MLSSGNTVFAFMKKKKVEDGFKEALKVEALEKNMVEYFNTDQILSSCESGSLSETVHYKNAKKCTWYW